MNFFIKLPRVSLAFGLFESLAFIGPRKLLPYLLGYPEAFGGFGVVRDKLHQAMLSTALTRHQPGSSLAFSMPGRPT